MRVRIFILSGILAFGAILIVFFVYAAMREEGIKYLETVTSKIAERAVSSLSEAFESFLNAEPWVFMIRNGEYDKVAEKLMEHEWISGVKIDEYSTPTGLNLCDREDGIKAKGCGNNIVLNIKAGGKKIQIYIKQDYILDMVESKRFKVVKSDKGYEILENYKIKVLEKGINFKLVLLIIGFFIISHYAAYRLFEKLARYSQQENALLPMIKMLETRDPYTAGHSRRVATVAREFAKELGIKGERLRILYKAALLHDIGKIGIPEKILLKPGKLLPDEFEIIKRHPLLTDEILRSIPGYSEVARIARYHHERCDGKGYPYHLKCEEIPLETKIITLADVYDALTSERAYRKSWQPEKALEYILENAGTQFDPKLAKKFVKFMKEKYIGIKEDKAA